eukprot:tig00001636_g9535.t1
MRPASFDRPVLLDEIQSYRALLDANLQVRAADQARVPASLTSNLRIALQLINALHGEVEKVTGRAETSERRCRSVASALADAAERSREDSESYYDLLEAARNQDVGRALRALQDEVAREKSRRREAEDALAASKCRLDLLLAGRRAAVEAQQARDRKAGREAKKGKGRAAGEGPAAPAAAKPRALARSQRAMASDVKTQGWCSDVEGSSDGEEHAQGLHEEADLLFGPCGAAPSAPGPSTPSRPPAFAPAGAAEVTASAASTVQVDAMRAGEGLLVDLLLRWDPDSRLELGWHRPPESGAAPSAAAEFALQWQAPSAPLPRMALLALGLSAAQASVARMCALLEELLVRKQRRIDRLLARQAEAAEAQRPVRAAAPAAAATPTATPPRSWRSVCVQTEAAGPAAEGGEGAGRGPAPCGRDIASSAAEE